MVLPTPEMDNHLKSLVKQILALKANDSTYNTFDLEQKIDHLVYELYGLGNDLIVKIESYTL